MATNKLMTGSTVWLERAQSRGSHGFRIHFKKPHFVGDSDWYRWIATGKQIHCYSDWRLFLALFGLTLKSIRPGELVELQLSIEGLEVGEG